MRYIPACLLAAAGAVGRVARVAAGARGRASSGDACDNEPPRRRQVRLGRSGCSSDDARVCAAATARDPRRDTRRDAGAHPALSNARRRLADDVS
eukprot:6198441-Pleurochrysis_carterae.AAC.1